MARPPPSSGSNTPAASEAPSSSTVRPPTGLSLPHMIQMDKEDKLSNDQTQILRTLIFKQCRNVVCSASLRGQVNPMTKLPGHLLPYTEARGLPPVCTKAAWDEAIANGLMDVKKIQEIMPMTELKKLLDIPADERTRVFAQDPVLKNRFTKALAHYAQQQQSRVNAVAAVPQRLETEGSRRRRKFEEMLGEVGIQAELGVHEVLGEILDTFVDAEALKAMRVAKHRKSNRVELRDMAFAIHDSTGITVPGFNVLPRDRIHTEGEKKRRTVVPLKPRTKNDDA